MTKSPALSLLARPGDGLILGRKLALLIAPGVAALAKAGVPEKLGNGKDDQGLIFSSAGNAEKAGAAFIKAIARHRHPERETDPPAV